MMQPGTTAERVDDGCFASSVTLPHTDDCAAGLATGHITCYIWIYDA